LTLDELRDFFDTIDAEFVNGEWLAPCPLYDEYHKAGGDPYKVVLSPGDSVGVLVHCRVCGRSKIGNLLGKWGRDADRLREPISTETAKFLWGQPGRSASKGYDVTFADSVYSTLLASLTLTEEHGRWLNARGIPTGSLSFFDYKTSPMPYGPETVSLLRKLRELYGDFELPGLVVGKTSRAAFRTPSILIPCRDREGRIFALKQRITKGTDRIRHFSFGEAAEVKSKSGTHWPKKTRTPGPVSDLVVTEGERKADLVSWLYPEYDVVAVPGAGILEQVIAEVQSICPDRLHFALDKDSAGVLATQVLHEKLWESAGEVYRWDYPEGYAKVDDLLADGKSPEKVRLTESTKGPPPVKSVNSQVLDWVRERGEVERRELEQKVSSAKVSEWIKSGRLEIIRKVSQVGQVLRAVPPEPTNG
jgi:hypothetical protein